MSSSASSADVTTPCASSSSPHEVVTLSLASSTQGGASDSSVVTGLTTTATEVFVQQMTSVSEKLVPTDVTSTSASVTSGSKQTEESVVTVTGTTGFGSAAEVDGNTQDSDDEGGTTLEVAIGNESTAAFSYLVGNGTDQSTSVQTTST